MKMPAYRLVLFAGAVPALLLAQTNGPVITATPLSGHINEPFYYALNATGGTAPYSWSLAQSIPGLQLNPATGVVTGTPTAGICCGVPVTVTDSNSRTATTMIAAQIVPAKLAAGDPLKYLLMDAVLPPFRCSAPSGLPPGLSLGDTDCSISGTVSAAGSYRMQVVRTAANQTTTFTVPLTVGIGIQPGALPGAVLGQAYRQTIATVGASGATTLQISGVLPAGLTFDAATGTVGGTPTGFESATFTVTATDAQGNTGSHAYAIALALPDLSAVTFTVPENVTSKQQPPVQLSIANSYPADLTGTLYLNFMPDPDFTLPDDFAVQFAPGGRLVDFTIPAGSTQAVFGTNTALKFQTGSSAGDIFLSVALRVGGRDVTPEPTPYRLLRIAKAAPVITSLSAAKTSSGIDITLAGYTTARELAAAKVRLVAAEGYQLDNTDFTIDLKDASGPFFQRSDTAAFGSQFSLRIPFNIQGSAAGISSVSVTLSNSLGDSQTMNATVQ